MTDKKTGRKNTIDKIVDSIGDVGGSLGKFGGSLEKTLEDWRLPAYSIPSIFEPPRFNAEALALDVPTIEETHSYESAGELLTRLEKTIRSWREELPSDAQPVIMAMVSGNVIVVSEFVEQGHSGIAIRGRLGERECLVLLHQSTLQLVCTIEKLKDEKQRYKIGFGVAGKKTEV